MPGVTGAGTAAVKLAQRLVQTPSPSGQEGAAVELLAEAMSAHGFDVRVDRAGNAIGSLGRGRPPAPPDRRARRHDPTAPRRALVT
jgi:putative aminopeptidase FrvX